MGAGWSKNAIGQRWCVLLRPVAVVVDVVGVPSCPASVVLVPVLVLVLVLVLVTVDVWWRWALWR